MSNEPNEVLARRLGDDKGELLKRLKEYKSCLKDVYRKHFRKFKYDFAKKQMISEDERLVLQWQLRSNPDEPKSYHNQQTSRGAVILFQKGTSGFPPVHFGVFNNEGTIQ